MTKKDQVQETEVEAVEEAPKAPRVTVKEGSGKGIEPNPAGKKGKVFTAGRSDEGGSIAALAEEMNCTTSNIRQHVAQCHTKLGYGYRIEGDNFQITGDTELSWETQAEAKAEIAAEKAAKAAEKAAAKKAAQAESGESEDLASDEPEGEVADEGDDFLE